MIGRCTATRVGTLLNACPPGSSATAVHASLQRQVAPAGRMHRSRAAQKVRTPDAPVRASQAYSGRPFDASRGAGGSSASASTMPVTISRAHTEKLTRKANGAPNWGFRASTTAPYT